MLWKAILMNAKFLYTGKTFFNLFISNLLFDIKSVALIITPIFKSFFISKLFKNLSFEYAVRPEFLLLKNLNPIIRDYMKQKQIRMVIDKKNLLVAEDSLDITKDIMALLNNKLKSIKLN